jgi:hypothetical protein
MLEQLRHRLSTAPSPTHQPTVRVARLAEDLHLGKFRIARKGANPLVTAVGLVVVGTVPLAALPPLAHIGVREPKIAGWAIGWFLVCIFGACGRLARGWVNINLYDHGLVRSKNTRLRAVNWCDVHQVTLWRGGEAFGGTLLCYFVHSCRRRISIAARIKDGRDEFGEQLQHLVTASGGKVVEGGPAAGQRRPPR